MIEGGTEMAAGARPTANTMRSPLWTVLGVSVLAVLTSACFGAQAKTIAVLPLDVPPAPPRTVEVRTPEIPPVMLMPEEPVHSTTPMPQPPPAPTAGPARPAEVPRAEATEAPARPEEAARPSSALQTTPTQQELEVERQVRTDLARAAADLARIDYRILGRDERTQYDTAQRFISQADAAVRARNLVFASNLADKAAALAGQLAGR